MRGITSFLKIEHESRITEKSVVYLAALEAGNDLLLDSSFGAQCGQGARKNFFFQRSHCAISILIFIYSFSCFLLPLVPQS